MSSTADQPGVRERHLLRKKDNPVFSESERNVSNEDLAEARIRDGMEMDRFLEDFQKLVQRAVELEPNAPSETILEIKEELDRSFQQACALPGDQSAIRNAIRKLVDVVMQAVRSSIGNDAYAARQLEEEAIARQAHYELQEIALVADLTHADSPLPADELIPSLLSEEDASLERVLFLFDHSQLATILKDAEDYLKAHDPGMQLSDARRRLKLIQDYYLNLTPPAENA